ncbi:helix-turn-helix domain-containing protein [Altererythrobacter sp. Z27]|uniref:helix-turn-helix domain-containing protein n=1 Tax=Altererythrobacter sp. Z27 TaxID=3461147 RepID=UPI0040445B4C
MAHDDNWHGHVTFEDRFVLFEGSVGDNHPHSHIAAQVVIGSDSRIETADGNEVRGSAIVVWPHVRHRLLSLRGGRVYLIEPTSDLGAALLENLPTGPVQVVEDAQERLESLLNSGPFGIVDERLQAALRRLQEPTALEEKLPEIARAVGLSPVRLRAIAARQLGMPLTSWRRWAAIRRACMAMVEGCSISDAAAVGGFSDQSHFTRTTRSMLGITPAVLSRIMA